MEQNTVDPEKLWFNTPDSASLCRGGGNGPFHPSQMYAIKKYVYPLIFSNKPAPITFLDYGCGSATTYEALMEDTLYDIDYLGVDIIPKNVEWCKINFPQGNFEINKSIHKIDQSDKSWDVVYSRHVVDHMESFEKAIDEHCRVAKELVIIVLWVPPGNMPDHAIKHIIDQGETYENEYTNQYSKPLIMKALKQKENEGWTLLEYTEDVGAEVRGHDTVIVLKRSANETPTQK